MTDAQLLARAIDVATEGNRSKFGRLLGHNDSSRVHTWLRGDRKLPPTERRICQLLIAHPSVARWLEAVE